MSAEQTPDIERVLAEHVQIRDVSGVVLCMCGEWIAYMAGGSPGDDDRHRAHVAQALAPVLAAAVREAKVEAWDEGERHESEYLATWGQFCPGRDCNPYRADRVAEPQHEAATSGKESEGQ